MWQRGRLTGCVILDSKCFRVLALWPTSHTVTLPFPPAAVTRKGESGQNEAAKIFPWKQTEKKKHNIQKG